MKLTPTGSNGRAEALGGIAGPEAVTVARDDREAGDLRVADQIVDLAALAYARRNRRRRDMRIAGPGHGAFVRPAGRFCGSARQSSVPSELPQIFHVARRALSWSLNQAFCVGAEDGLRRRVLARIRDARVVE